MVRLMTWTSNKHGWVGNNISRINTETIVVNGATNNLNDQWPRLIFRLWHHKIWPEMNANMTTTSLILVPFLDEDERPRANSLHGSPIVETNCMTNEKRIGYGKLKKVEGLLFDTSLPNFNPLTWKYPITKDISCMNIFLFIIVMDGCCFVMTIIIASMHRQRLPCSYEFDLWTPWIWCCAWISPWSGFFELCVGLFSLRSPSSVNLCRESSFLHNNIVIICHYLVIICHKKRISIHKILYIFQESGFFSDI